MNQVRYVLAAARHLNFTRAAEDCNVTQPALTKGIKALEAELGAPVFHREGRRISVSAFGQSMLGHLEHILEEAEATRLLAQSYRLLEKAPLRLGVLSTIGHVRLARFLGRLERGHSGMELSVTEGSMADLSRKLDDGEIDVAVATLTGDVEDRFRVLPLYSERYVVVFPSDHRLAAENTVPLAKLSGEAYVDRLACELREMVMGVCEAEGVQLYARFRSEREDWVQAMVMAGIGFAFMPEYSVTLPGLLQRPLVDPAVDRRVGVLTMPGRPHPPALDAFLRAAKGFDWPG